MDPNESLTPVERIRAHLLQTGHDDDANAFAAVDWLIQNYLLTDEPLDQGATELQNMLLDVVNAWTPKN